MPVPTDVRQQRRSACALHGVDRARGPLTHAVVDGDEVAVQGRFAGTARDGRALELRFADFFRLDGERIAYRTTYFYAPLA